jgi:hypothetical protein
MEAPTYEFQWGTPRFQAPMSPALDDSDEEIRALMLRVDEALKRKAAADAIAAKTVPRPTPCSGQKKGGQSVQISHPTSPLAYHSTSFTGTATDDGTQSADDARNPPASTAMARTQSMECLKKHTKHRKRTLQKDSSPNW